MMSLVNPGLVLRLVIPALLLAVDPSQLVKPAGAHSALSGWTYPLDCCNEFDCRELDTSEVKVGSNFYIWKEHRIAFDSPKIRRSPDGRFHGCENAHWGDTSGRLEVSCFFVPAQG